MTLVGADPAKIERLPHESGDVVTVLVDSGASGHYFDDTIIPYRNHLFRTTPPSVRHAQFLRLEKLCQTALRRGSYKASSQKNTENSTKRRSQS